MGNEQKTCSAGPDCKHPAGPALPITEFYDYSATGGRRFGRCKACAAAGVLRRREIDLAEEVDDRLEILRKLTKPGQAATLYRWISENLITRGEYATLYRELTRGRKLTRRKIKV